MEVDMNTLHKDMLKLQRELELIKNIIVAEGELSDWAKDELKKAREEDESDYISLDEAKRKISAKK